MLETRVIRLMEALKTCATITPEMMKKEMTGNVAAWQYTVEFGGGDLTVCVISDGMTVSFHEQRLCFLAERRPDGDKPFDMAGAVDRADTRATACIKRFLLSPVSEVEYSKNGRRVGSELGFVADAGIEPLTRSGRPRGIFGRRAVTRRENVYLYDPRQDRFCRL